MGEWLISMLRAKALQQNSLEMTVCRWPWPSITVPQLPQGETDGAQSALIKWKFTRCKAARCLYILGQAFHKAFSSPTCPRRTPSKNWKSTLDTDQLSLAVMLWLLKRGFCTRPSPSFVWLPPMSAIAQWRYPSSAVAQWRSPSSGSCLQYSSVFLHLVLYVPAVAHWCLLPCTCDG